MTTIVVELTDPAPPIVVELAEVGLVGPAGEGGGSGDADAVAEDLAAHEADTTGVHGIADTAALETSAGAQSKANAAAAAAVEAHRVDSTDVHGIVNTALLETATGAQAKADAAAAAAVEAHRLDATDVHGIADTAALETSSGAQAKATQAQSDAVATAHSYTDTALVGEAAARNTAIAAAFTTFLGAPPAAWDTWLEIITAVQADEASLVTVITQLAGKQDASASLTALAAVAATTFGRNLLTMADAAALRTALTLAAIATSGSIDDVAESATRKILTAAERTKLTGVATGATANATDAQLRDRSTHTGTQDLDSITETATKKVLTSTERTKLAGLATLATSGSADDVAESATKKVLTSTERTKLTGVATGATANATDAQLRDRSTHTGTQDMDSLTETAGKKVMTAAERTAIAANTAAIAAAALHGAIRLDSVHPALGTGTATTVGSINVNTSAEVTLATLTIPAALVAALDLLELRFGFDLFQNSGGAIVYTFKVKLNGTTIFTTAPSFPNAAALRPRGDGRFTIDLAAINDQRWHGAVVVAAAVGAGNMGAMLAVGNQGVGSVATTADLTVDATVVVTAQMASANAAADVRLLSASLVRVR